MNVITERRNTLKERFAGVGSVCAMTESRRAQSIKLVGGEEDCLKRSALLLHEMNQVAASVLKHSSGDGTHFCGLGFELHAKREQAFVFILNVVNEKYS